MKKELSPIAVAAIAVVTVGLLAALYFLTVGQPPSGPGPNAQDLPQLTPEMREEFQRNESRPPSGPTDSRSREDLTGPTSN